MKPHSLTVAALILFLAIPGYAQKPFKPSKSQLRAEYWHRMEYQRPVDGALRRLKAAQSDLDLFVNTPAEKRISEPLYSQLLTDQRALVQKYVDEMRAAQDKLATFDRMLADSGARALFHAKLKEQQKAGSSSASTYINSRYSITIRCYSYSTRHTYRARCDVY